MRRVVSIWFPHWPTDRLRRPPSPETGPLVTALHDGRRRVVAATDPAAATCGLHPGMALAQALALVPGLDVIEADHEADRLALERLARWCHRTTPLTAVDEPDGIWLDSTGCSHLAGDETRLLDRLLARFARDGLQARAAMADTPGAAHALARYAPTPSTIVPPGGQAPAIAGLPIAALRLPAELVVTLRRLGFDQVRHLSRIPRAQLARRFGPLPGLRLDQAQGAVHEPLRPLLPEHPLHRRAVFLEPLLTAEALATAIAALVAPLCEEMEHTGRGARQLDLLFERVDAQIAAIRIGTARPSRDAPHLTRMLTDRLETIDPGHGIEALHLIVPLAEPLRWHQQTGAQSGANPGDIAHLVDRLANRLGANRIYRASPVQSEQPERAVGTLPPELPQDLPPDLRPTVPQPRSPLHQTSTPHGSSAPIKAPTLSVVLTPPDCERPNIPPLPAASRPAASHPRPHLRLVPPTPPNRPPPNRPPPNRPPTDRPPPDQPQTDQPQTDQPAKDTQQDVPDHDAPALPWKGPWALRRNRPDKPAQGQPPAASSTWPTRLHAPPRLLDPPRPIEALAGLPDQPPVAFTWRHRRHRIRHADGPDRVHGEWWRHAPERHAVRDYFQVEDETGQRFWLFRQGNGIDPETGDLSWFLHGLF